MLDGIRRCSNKGCRRYTANIGGICAACMGAVCKEPPRYGHDLATYHKTNTNKDADRHLPPGERFKRLRRIVIHRKRVEQHEREQHEREACHTG